MAKLVRAPERLKLLLQWLDPPEDARPTSAEARELFIAFYLSCSRAWDATSPGFGGLWPRQHPGQPWGKAMTDRQLERLRLDMRRLLEDAFNPVPPDATPETAHHERTMRFPSLRFGVNETRRRPARLPRGSGVAERREHNRLKRLSERPGHFSTYITGELRDLALFALWRTMSEAGTVKLSRCMAPAQGDPSRECGRFVVSGGQRGPQRVWCSDPCKRRVHTKKEAAGRKKPGRNDD